VLVRFLRTEPFEFNDFDAGGERDSAQIYRGGNVETLFWRNESSMFRSIGLTK